MTSKTTLQMDFVREAVREKATRELVALNQRADAFGSVDRARDTLFTLTADLAHASGAVAAVATDATVVPRMKKLRKLLDEAHALATELADTLGTDAHREALNASRAAILEALRASGIDPETVLPTTGGDAQ
ncbi:MAG: hypothetical protein HY909_16445 [Deltaproteobacteria bacterium]|nr:hypothetical protein [Deltaproteobacteria bacterium]